MSEAKGISSAVQTSMIKKSCSYHTSCFRECPNLCCIGCVFSSIFTSLTTKHCVSYCRLAFKAEVGIGDSHLKQVDSLQIKFSRLPFGAIVVYMKRSRGSSTNYLYPEASRRV